uniref:Prostaglandin reductase 1 n=3 Tax=Photinus pyralis TaxID=7054 RepID=A0A1Y1MGI5_PHOPY
MVTAKKFILKKKFSGAASPSNVEIVEEELPPIKDGEFLTEAVYISVDPYQRAYNQEVGQVMAGIQVAKIIESKLESYPVGKYVVTHFGWRTHTISEELTAPWGIVLDFGNLPLSLALGVLGMTGNTAYFGLMEICKPQKGETVVVSGAGGAVGSHVGQIAKIIGCKVIGILGDDEKGKYITEELGFDHYINYKKANIKEELTTYAPDGIDCYFDNVGGDISATVISLMNKFGRISVCGSISSYTLDTYDMLKFTPIAAIFIGNELRMEGFMVTRWFDRWNEGIEQNLKWVKEGKLKYRETITEGFENTIQAFMDMYEGKNTGKAIVKI